jgi:hypothetical protein
MSAGNITIAGGEVFAYGSNGAAGIGGINASGSRWDITITGGTVNAFGGSNSPGIGG